jgi:hypothetical protein
VLCWSPLRRLPLTAPCALCRAGSGDGQQQHRLQQQQQQQPTATPRDARLALPLPWADYFERQQRVHCSDRQATFNVYSAGTCAAAGLHTLLLCSRLDVPAALSCRALFKPVAGRSALGSPSPDPPTHPASPCVQAPAAQWCCVCTAAATRALPGPCSPGSSVTGGVRAGSAAAAAPPAASGPAVGGNLCLQLAEHG